MNYQVLSIAGYHRSGTTFLGKLLNKYEDAFFIGELDRGRQNYNNGFLNNCGCGCEIPRCPVWSRMIKDSGFYREKDFSTYFRISEQLGVHLLIDSSKRISQMEGISLRGRWQHSRLPVIRSSPSGFSLAENSRFDYPVNC